MSFNYFLRIFCGVLRSTEICYLKIVHNLMIYLMLLWFMKFTTSLICIKIEKLWHISFGHTISIVDTDMHG